MFYSMGTPYYTQRRIEGNPNNHLKWSSMSSFTVSALYKFVRLENYESLQQPLLSQMKAHGVKGTILLAHEGINGTISGPPAGVQAVLDWLHEDQRLDPIDVKQSEHSEAPFHRSKVKLKKEIVTMGVENIDPNKSAGTYVDPEQWNHLLEDDDVIVIDTRNKYEIEIGSFKNAINPETDSFREFPSYADKHLSDFKDKKIAMYCTGGIRCEKSTAYLKQHGFKEVYHLKGGILKYLEKTPAQDSLWQGECFVFDDRVAVNHKLEKGIYEQCHACRFPITAEQMQHEHYVAGVSCPRCFGKHTKQQLQRFEERQKQIELAKERGESHFGSAAIESSIARKAEKLKRRNPDQK